ncbi:MULTISPECIES: DUF1656 domain-containing protein [Cobetia]|nr:MULTISPECIES: DUF1656 domain-containing protein [Cobetia]
MNETSADTGFMAGFNGLHEMVVGEFLISPMLVYALVALLAAGLIRSLLHRLLANHELWFEAWFDISLFIICLAAVVALVT